VIGDGARTAESAPEVPLVLCEAFAETLGVPEVAPDDHFFNLGGHSLLVMRAVASIEARLGILLPPSAIFEHPTVRSLTRHLSAF
jgi:acyl carrier protein